LSTARTNLSPTRLGGAVLAALVLVLVLAAWLVPTPDTHRPAPSIPADEHLSPLHRTGARPTVAVVPFSVDGNDAEPRHLARGLTSDLTADLGQLGGLTLIGGLPTGAGEATAPAPLSASSYRVLGDIDPAGERIGLRLVLIETASREQLWSRRYHGRFEALPELQLQAALDLAGVLGIEVTAWERHRLARRHSQSAAAYELLLRAQASLLRREAPANRRARILYRRALDQEPEFARAWGGVALTYAADYRNQWTPDPPAALAEARAAAETAVRLDPELPEVLWVLAYVEVQQRNHARALELLDRAIDLSPSFADAYVLKGAVLTYLGDPQEAVPLLQRAIRLDPGTGYLPHLVLGRAYFQLDAHAEAIASLREAVTRNPSYLESHVYLAAAAVRAGERDLAEWEVLEIRTLDPDFAPAAWLATNPVSDAGQAEDLLGALAEAGL
jgi:tetratricopeptide (TPR) repeat protein